MTDNLNLVFMKPGVKLEDGFYLCYTESDNPAITAISGVASFRVLESKSGVMYCHSQRGVYSRDIFECYGPIPQKTVY